MRDSTSVQPDASFRVLSDVARLLVSESDLSRLLESIAESLGSLIPHDSLIIYQADTSLRRLQPVYVHDEHADEIYRSISQFGEGITGLVAERREAILANDADLDPRSAQIEGTPLEEESLLCVPLQARDELKGVLNLYRIGRGNGFSEEEFALAERFAELAALAIDNAQIRERLQSEIVTDRLTGLYNHRYFQERLAEEMRRSAITGQRMSLVLMDIDEFKRVNETDGHLSGDHVLSGLGTLLRSQARSQDLICRVGGEEFAIIMPGTGAPEALLLADDLRQRVAGSNLNGSGGTITVSMGVAEGPSHATGPRELMACANYALLQAKASGRDQVSPYLEGEWSGVRAVPQHEVRMIQHLKLLQTVSSKLNRLQDVGQIADTVIREMRELIEYHNCRIHLLDPDGVTLRPVAFRGELTEYEGETYEALVTMVGEGITGRVAQTGEPIYAPDAAQCEFAVQIPGTLEVDESILAAPLKFDDRVIGTIVLSNLGLNQFDADDLRLLESLASSAAVAFQNARLFEEERQSADTANALLRVSQALTRSRDPQRVLQEVVGSLSDLLGCPMAAAWLRDEQGEFTCRVTLGHTPQQERLLRAAKISRATAGRYLLSVEEPFYLPAEVVDGLPEELRLWPEGRPVLVAPFQWEPDGLGALIAMGEHRDAMFAPRDFRLARGIADLASLAMGNAHRFADLEHAFIQTVEVLANALEAKDEYTSGHAREVAELATSLGRELGMEPDELRMLELGGMFHDIGKIGVPSEIINKPGPLTDEEMEIMKRHPEIGEQILGPVKFLRPVCPIVRSGHERWDGHGYPDGLAGEDIPLGARIIFVCDAYHAMTSDRSYRKALPQEEAIRRLREAAGTQFDPGVVEGFISLHARGLIGTRAHAHAHSH